MSSADKGGLGASSVFFLDCPVGGAGAFLGDRNVGVEGVFGRSTELLIDALIPEVWDRLRGCASCVGI